MSNLRPWKLESYYDKVNYGSRYMLLVCEHWCSRQSQLSRLLVLIINADFDHQLTSSDTVTDMYHVVGLIDICIYRWALSRTLQE